MDWVGGMPVGSFLRGILSMAEPSRVSDQDLAYDINAALSRDHLLRATLSELEGRVQDGRVTLRGYARDESHARRAEDAASSVRGVASVQNLIVSDTELRSQVALALGEDVRTSGYPYAVEAFRGVVRITGKGLPLEVQAATHRVTAGVLGVRAVIDELRGPQARAAPLAEAT
jgi:osmotically-inducible protein OsmY